MALSKKERRFWKYKFQMNPNDYPEHHGHLNFKDGELTSEELGYLCKRIKSVEQLDLDNCPVDDAGISSLTEIDHIKELRLKGLNITDLSAPYLNKITSLELLHVGGTEITCEGILQLSSLKRLKTLLCSPKAVNHGKLQTFLKAVPGCELIVGYKKYTPKI